MRSQPLNFGSMLEVLFHELQSGLRESFNQGFKFMAYKLKCFNDRNTLTTVAKERLDQKNYDVKLTNSNSCCLLQQQTMFFLKTWSLNELLNILYQQVQIK